MKKIFLTLLAVGSVFTACQKDEIDALTKDLDRVNASLDYTIATLQEATETIAANNETIAMNIEEIDSLSAEIVGYLGNIENLEGDNAQLTADLEGLQAEFDALDADYKEVSAELAQAVLDLAALNADLESAEEDIAAKQAQIIALQARIIELEAALQEAIDNVRTVYVGGGGTTVVGAVWSPAYDDITDAQKMNGFDQTSEVEGHSVSRTVSVTSSVSSTISTEVAEGVDVNEDGDLSDDISRDVTTYTASYDLGSRTVNGEWTVSQDNDAPVADTTAPVITVLTRTADFTVDRTAGFTSPIEFRSHSTHSNEGVLMLNGEVFDVATQIVGLAAGTHEYVFTATDEAGNSSSLTFTIEVAAVEIPSGTVTDTTSGGSTGGEQTGTPSGGGSTTPEVNPADVPGAWSYSDARVTDAIWDAGIITLTDTSVVSISVSRSRIWTINGERDASTPSDLNASNQEVVAAITISNSAYQAPVDPADTLSAWSYTSGLNEAAWIAGEFDFGASAGASVLAERTRTVIVNGVADATPPAGALSEEKDIRNTYVAPVTGTVTINGFATTSGFGFTGASYTALSVSGPNGAVALNGQSFNFDGAGTYTITFGISGATTLTVDLEIDSADDAGSYTISDPDNVGPMPIQIVKG